jgi:hypothetical protein
MADFGVPQLFIANPQHRSAELSFPSHSFSSLDFLRRQNSFGFSPGTSPAPNDIKNERSSSEFGAQNGEVSGGQLSYLATNDFRHPFPSENHLDQPGSPQSVRQPSLLFLPSTVTKQKHGQLTPPSEPTPTNDPQLAADSQGFMGSPAKTRDGPTTGKRRSTQPRRVMEFSAQPTTTIRRRKKSAGKQSSSGLAADNGDRRTQFLERNRVAASKCRLKKKEWTSNLEQRARELQASKSSLSLLVSSLRQELLYLKGEALRHDSCDCNSVREYLARHAEDPLSCGPLEYTQSPHSSSSLSFDAMALDPSITHSSPDFSTTPDYHNLPELDLLGQIPD